MVRAWLRRRRVTRRASAVAIAVVLVIVGTGVAVASIPGPDGVISGCYGKVGGVLRVIDTATQKCTSLEKPLAWNQTGPQGPAGAAGKDGAPGAQGPAGPAGTAGAAGLGAPVYLAANDEVSAPFGQYLPEHQDVLATLNGVTITLVCTTQTYVTIGDGGTTYAGDLITLSESTQGHDYDNTGAPVSGPVSESYTDGLAATPGAPQVPGTDVPVARLDNFGLSDSESVFAQGFVTVPTSFTLAEQQEIGVWFTLYLTDNYWSTPDASGVGGTQHGTCSVTGTAVAISGPRSIPLQILPPPLP